MSYAAQSSPSSRWTCPFVHHDEVVAGKGSESQDKVTLNFVVEFMRFESTSSYHWCMRLNLQTMMITLHTRLLPDFRDVLR